MVAATFSEAESLLRGKPKTPEAMKLQRPWMLSSALRDERRGQCLVQCLIGRLAEMISASGRRDPRSRKVRASLLPITATQASLHLPQTATSAVRQLSTARTEKRGVIHPRPGQALAVGNDLTSFLSSRTSRPSQPAVDRRRPRVCVPSSLSRLTYVASSRHT